MSWPAVLRIRNRDPGLGAFLTPGSGIRDGRKSASGSGIRDEQPGSYFLELRNHFFAVLGLKYLNSLMRIRDPGWKKDKHPGSATLPAGNRPGPPDWEASKEPFEQLVNSYSEHLHLSPRPVENARDTTVGTKKIINFFKTPLDLVRWDWITWNQWFADPWHLGTDPDADPDSRIRTCNLRIRMWIRAAQNNY